MDSFQIFRSTLSTGAPPATLFEKPQSPSALLDSAVWRFLKAWKDNCTLGADEAVLFRQVLRWGQDGIHVGEMPREFRKLLKSCSLSINAANIATARGFRPDWIQNDVLPEEGIDAPPVYRQDKTRIPAENYLSTLKRVDGTETLVGFDKWKSVAQKEGAWLTLTAANGSTNLVVLPTGMGKSLCFQLLPIFSSGLTVVVVPTVALAIDQCSHAKEAFHERPDVNPQYFAANDPGVDPAVVVDQINQGRTRLVFTSPEACVSGRLRFCLEAAAKKGVLANLVLDEAHIVSSWGMYFRVDFQLLAGLRRKWKADTQGQLRTFLFTATLTPEQKRNVFDLFSDGDSNRNEFLFHSLRPELAYYDRCFDFQNEQLAALKECLWHLPRPAILYTTEVKEAESLHSQIVDMGFRRTACFTGNTKSFERRELLDKWRQDELDLMVATSAFGLGVDKPDVRTVIHCCLPEDLNRYYQEVGRSGRDGFSSVSILIPSKRDIGVAKRMKPKLLSTGLVQERWRAMWDTREAINADEYEWRVQLNSKRYKLLGDRTYRQNVTWNKRLILQLSRAGLIEITNLTFDSELSKELGEYQEFVSLKIKHEFNPASTKIGESIKQERREEAEENSRGFQSLCEYLAAGRCISRILKQLYGENTLRTCGGCRWCRNEERKPTDPPVFEYESTQFGSVKVVEACPDPFVPKPRLFTKLIRSCADKGIRRFACHVDHYDELLRCFNSALGPQVLFRLDGIESGDEFELAKPEKLIAFHIEQPSRSLFGIGGASEVTHMLCGSINFQDVRYLLPQSANNPDFFTSTEMWS